MRLGRTAVHCGECTVLFDNRAGTLSSYVLELAADVVLLGCATSCTVTMRLGRTAVHCGECTVLFDNQAGTLSSYVLELAADVVLAGVIPQKSVANVKTDHRSQITERKNL